MTRSVILLLAAFLALLTTGCFGSSADDGGGGRNETAGELAPELVGITDWLNGRPVTITELTASEQVVLVDFWTYTCVNCIRTLPFLKEWHEKYGENGLTILGIHSPEFEFEKIPANVAAAVEANGLEYLVAQDNDMQTWDVFETSGWPSKYLINADGRVVYTHVGEGDYIETEEAIREALEVAGHDLGGIPVGTSTGPEPDPIAPSVTRELYGGYKRNYNTNGVYAGQEEYYDGGDQEVLYEDEGDHRNGQWYLQGLWRNESQAIVHARETENLEDYIAVPFAARSVNVVLNPDDAPAFAVYVEIDGRPLTEEEAGADILFDEEGRSYITGA